MFGRSHSASSAYCKTSWNLLKPLRNLTFGTRHLNKIGICFAEHLLLFCPWKLCKMVLIFGKKPKNRQKLVHTVEYQHHLHIQVPWVSDRQHQWLPTLDFSHCCTLHSEFCIFEQLFKEPSKITMCFKGQLISKYPFGVFVSTQKPTKFV